MSTVEPQRSLTDMNPAVDIMNLFTQRDEILTEAVLKKTNAIKETSQKIRSLNEFINKVQDEFGIGIHSDGKQVTEMDFTKCEEVKNLMDRLNEKGLLDDRYKDKYVFHSANEIDQFIEYLKGKIQFLNDETHPDYLAITPLLDLKKQLTDIVKKIIESNERMISSTHKQ